MTEDEFRDSFQRKRRGGGSKTPPTLADLRASAGRYLLLSPLLLIPLLLIFVVTGILNVAPKQVAILIRKTGEDPPNGSIVAQKEGQKGIVLEPLSEGFYWRNPFTWDWVIVDMVQVPEGKLGVKIRQYGAPLDPGQVIARAEQKGILEDPLGPGSHRVNTLVDKVLVQDVVQVPAGYLGIVTLLAGSDAKEPNRFVVNEGEKGVQKKALAPGTYLFNPFVKRVDTVDMRAHRFDMEAQDAIRFPSSDGFSITMVGTIEWYVDQERVAEVFVKYGDEREIIEKIILPNARAFSRIEGSKHLAREFISGVTRQEFQDAFLAGLGGSCAKQGVLIKSALVRDTVPPEEIANPIRQREIAAREKDKYEQEKEREIQEKQLAMETMLMDRMTKTKDAEAKVSIQVTKAKEDQQVAVIQASQKLDVAKLELKAAENQAKAAVERGKAAADVVLYNNKAKAAGIRDARVAFKESGAYVKYLYYQKIAPALSYILSNTDGPFADIFKEFAEGKSASKPDSNR